VKRSPLEDCIGCYRFGPSHRYGFDSAIFKCRFLLFASLIFVLLTAPAFFGKYYFTSEEQVGLFSSEFGLRLFFPGQNRLMSILPLIASWAPSLYLAAIVHFFIVVSSVTISIAFFAYFLPKALFYSFTVWGLLMIILVFGGDSYRFHLSTVQPYIVPFAVGLINAVILLNCRELKFPFNAIFYVISFVCMLAATGINPTVSVFWLTFFSLYLLINYLSWRGDQRFVLPAATQLLHWIDINKIIIRVGLMYNLICLAAIFYLYFWYKESFPQYVKSNYSIDSYATSGLSVDEFFKFVSFAADFQARACLFGIETGTIIFFILVVGGWIWLPLWLNRRRPVGIFSGCYGLAFLLWASAIITSVVISQNAHIQLVPNLIRGRYFSFCYYAMVLSFTVALSAASLELSQKWLARSPEWIKACPWWFGIGVILVSASIDVQYRKVGPPRFELHHNWHRELVDYLKGEDISAIVGDYWWIWDIQYELNKEFSGVPAVTPVAIRTESFGLNVFKPILDQLAHRQKFRFACIEQKDPPAAPVPTCQEQIQGFEIQGSFPKGHIRKLKDNILNTFKITIYEQSLTPVDAPECAAAGILFRADPSPSASPEVVAFVLQDDSFIYLQNPVSRVRWSVTVNNRYGEQVVDVPLNSRVELSALRRHMSFTSSGCRLLIAIFDREELFPRSTRLTIR
jgi:hypothetical protein